MMTTRTTREKGATAIFVVMFAAVLFLIITVGFVRLMVQEQSRSTNAELSQSAYDAALAGVEDGKRVLSMANCDVGDATCATIKSSSGACDIVQQILKIGDANEVLLKTQSALDTTSQSFDQAYTCVRVDYASPNYEGQLPAGQPDVVHLKGVSPYTQVRLSWFSRDDMPLAGAGALSYVPVGLGKPLYDLQSWSSGGGARPSVMKATYIPTGIPAAAHDTEDRTLYLYPRSGGLATTASFNLDNRRSGSATNIVDATGCIATFTVQEYACTATMTLPAATSDSYIYLAAAYGATSFKVELLDSTGTPVDLDGVQPIIDSTGRAGDVFRRVSARVERIVGTDYRAIYPRATVDITNNFCKAFSVGTDTVVYSATKDNCKPDQAGL